MTPNMKFEDNFETPYLSGSNEIKYLEKVAYHLRTLYLFSKSDIPTSVGTTMMFVIAGFLVGPTMIRDIPALGSFEFIRGATTALYFSWHLTLCFNIGNQRLPQSVIEDGTNKPWRPVPAGRISPESALWWQLVAITSLLALCVAVFGAVEETLFYLFCTWLYNQRGWGDKSWWQRTLLNVCGITTNRAASFRVAAAVAAQGQGQGPWQRVYFTEKALGWLAILATIIFTTVQVQDLRDQEGDAQINRQTFPLILGDWPTRWMSTIAILIWSVVCPLYWGLGCTGYVFTILIGAAISMHVVVCRDRASDHKSFRLLGAWWVSLYFLPVLAMYGL